MGVEKIYVTFENGVLKIRVRHQFFALTKYVFTPTAGIASFSRKRETLVWQTYRAHIVPQYVWCVHKNQRHVVVKCTAVIFFVFYDSCSMPVLEREKFILGL